MFVIIMLLLIMFSVWAFVILLQIVTVVKFYSSLAQLNDGKTHIRLDDL